MDSDIEAVESSYNESDTSLFNIRCGTGSFASATSENKLLDTIREYLEGEDAYHECVPKPATLDIQTLAKKEWKDEHTGALTQSQNVSSRMSPIEIALVCPLIEEAIRQVNIVKSPYPNVEIYFDFLDVFERFKNKQEKSLLNLKDHGDIIAREKFALDLGRLKKLLRMVKDDLLFADDSFIDRYIALDKLKLKKLKDMVNSNRKLSSRLYNLKEDIKHLHNLAETTRKNSPVTTLHRQELIDETAIKIGTLIEFVKKYDNGRIEQNRLRMEVNLKREIDEIKIRTKEIEEEHICHEAIVTYCKKSLDGLEADIDYWEKKYIKDMEDVDLKMDCVDEEVGENASRLSRLLEDYNQRQMQINIYEGEKEELFERQILDNMMESVILAAQSWFRGTMVRWELGQYAPDFERKRSESTLKSFRESSPPEPEEEEEEEIEEEQETVVGETESVADEGKTQEGSESQPTEDTKDQPKE